MVMPPPGPPPLAPMQMPPDPETIYQMAQQVQRVLEQQADLMMQPQYPPWYDPDDYAEPDAAAALTKARELEADFGPLKARINDELRLTRNAYFGAFKSDYDEDTDDPWYDTTIQGEIELLSYQLADSTMAFDAKPRKIDHRDEAAKKVDFAQACLTHAARLHAVGGNGPLPVEKARTLLTTGRLAWHCMLNLDADEDEMPFQEFLVDPASCFPVFEANKGMRLMVRVYETTAGEAVASFDDAERTLYKQLIAKDTNDRARHEDKRDEGEMVEVIEYWDRRWRVIYIDTKPVRTIEHEYGFVPFVYKVGPLGTPGFMRDPGDPDESATSGLSEYTAQHRATADKHKGVGLPTLLKTSTQLREATYVRMMRAFKSSMTPALLTYIDEVAWSQGVPDISQTPGDNSPVKKDRHQVDTLPVTPNANVLMPILQGVADNTARLSQPPTAHGLNDHSNVSGYATQGLNEAGRIKLVPWLRALEAFEEECMQMRFRMFRDWGYLITQGGSTDYGTIIVPRADAAPYEDQTVELTPGDLRRAGIAIGVSIRSMPLQMLGQVANAIGIMMQLGIEDKIGALKKLGDPNPYKTLERIQQSQVLDDPVLVEADVIQALFDQGAEGKAQYVLARKMADKMQAQAGAAGPPGVQGESQASMGHPPGPGSGPQGPVTAPTSPQGTEP